MKDLITTITSASQYIFCWNWIRCFWMVNHGIYHNHIYLHMNWCIHF